MSFVLYLDPVRLTEKMADADADAAADADLL